MDKKEKTLREQLGELIDQQEAIVNKAKAADRNLNSNEKRNFDHIDREIKQKKSELDDHINGRSFEGRARLNKQNLFGGGSEIDLTTGKPSGRTGLSGNKHVEEWKSLSEGSKGKRIPVLSNKARLADVIETSEYGGSPQDYIIDRYRGFTATRGADVKAEGPDPMSTSADSAMVPIDVSSAIIDEARNLSRVMQAGALTVPMSTKELTIARITQSASPHWKAENAKITPSEIKTEPVTFTSKTLVAGVKSSVELSEDAQNLGNVVFSNLVEQLSLELDRAALMGTGSSNEPRGILHTDGVQEIEMGDNGAELESYAPFSEGFEKILSANGFPNACIYSPRTWGVLDRLVDQNDQPLNPPMSFRDLMQLPTSQIPNDMVQGSAENASAAFIGEYPKLMIGMRTRIILEVSRHGFDGDTSAWENLQIMWRAYLRADVQLAHPAHFCIIKGIIPGT